MSLVGTYWQCPTGDKTVFKAIEKVCDMEDINKGYHVLWLLDSISVDNPGERRRKLLSLTEIARCTQLTEDEYLLMLIE
tara:strand:+ start:430 stop:666 length:237 start_codon:yes stop_codon:yes gene_type:complete